MKDSWPVRFLVAPTALAFSLRFMFLVLAFTALTLTAPFHSAVEEPLLHLNAWLAHRVLVLLGAQATLAGTLVTSPGFSMEVVSGCTGLFIFLVLLAGVLAFPARWSHRIKGFLGGAVLLFVLNLVRIVSLFFLGRLLPDHFEDFHFFIWQGIIILVTAFYWYSWALRERPPQAPAAA
jgi:exosortase H (IPTLxxWG-CTERM-specific)